MVCSCYELNVDVLCLLNSNYIELKLMSVEDRINCSRYLEEPKFMERSLVGCDGNKIENGFPLDPITHEPIPEEERFILGNTCYFKETMKLLVNSNDPIDPLTRTPIPQDIITMFKK